MANIIEDVVYIIGAKDITAAAYASAKAGLAALNDKSKDIAAQMDSHWQAFKKNWLGVTAAFWATLELLKKAWNFAEVAAGYNEHMQAIDAMAKQYGTSGAAIVGKIDEIGEGMLSLVTIAETADSAMTKGMKPDMLYNLAEAAVALSDSMKMTADEAFKTLVGAMEMGKEKTLKLATGTIDLKDRYGEMADKMSEAEKQTAFMGIVMEMTRKKQAELGGETKSVADRTETFAVTLKNLQLELGQGLIRAGAAAVGTFQLLAGAALGVVGGFYSLRASIREFMGDQAAAAKATIEANAAFAARDALFAKADANFTILTASTEDLQKATGKQTVATTQHTQSEGDRQKVISETTKALDAYGKTLQKYGEELLKIGKETFGDKLKEEKITIAEMNTALTVYLATVKSVYDARIAGEKAIEDAMKKAGAKPKDILEAQAQILKSERAHLVERLGGWRLYYNTLSSQHDKAVDAMKKKTEEMKKQEEDLAALRRTATETMMNLTIEWMKLQGKQANDEEIFLLKNKALHDQWALAESQSGEARIKSIQEYIKMLGQMNGDVVRYYTAGIDLEGKVVQGQQTIITNEELVAQKYSLTKAALSAIETEQLKINAAKAAELAAVKQNDEATTKEMSEASREMTAYQQQINALAEKIAQMDKVIALTVNDQASGPIAGIRAQLESLVNRQWAATVTINQQTVGGQGGGGTPVIQGQGGAGTTPGPVMGGGGGTWTLPDDSWFRNNNSPAGSFEWNRAPVFTGTALDRAAPSAVAPGAIPSGEEGLMPHTTHDMPSGPGIYVTAEGFLSSSGSPYNNGFGKADPWLDSYAKGTKYVPRTGPYLLHEGESVKTATETKAGGGQVINFSPQITIQGVNKSPEQLAREIVKPLQAELKRLAAVT